MLQTKKQLIIGIMIATALLVSFFVVVDQSLENREKVAEHALEMEMHDIDIVWPESGVYLEGIQTFTFTFAGDDTILEAPDLIALWEVDDGIRSGVLRQTSNGFTTTVDVTDWDWNRHGNYRLLFRLYAKDTKVARSEVMVRTGTALDISQSTTPTETTMTEETDIPHISEEVAVAPQVLGTNNDEEDTASHLGYPSSDIRDDESVVHTDNYGEALVEWMPAPVDQNQRFRYQLGAMDHKEVNAFWKSQGGHQNPVYVRDQGVIEAVINMYGWRWREQGPYEVTFSVVDAETSEPLKQETLVMNWAGEPGNSEMNIRSQGVMLTSTSVTPSRTVSQSTATTPPTTPPSPESQPATATEMPQPSTETLLSVDKPAVRSSLREQHSVEYQEAMEYILSQPNAVWLNGDGYDSNERIRDILDQATTENALPTFVLYNIPHRDCGSHSSGGAGSDADYRAWIDRLASVLTNERGLVIVEPDALAQLNCAPAEARSERLQLISYAVTTLTQTSPHLSVYIDAGHPYWVGSSEMARRLTMAGVAEARGFALNVSNYVATIDNVTYGDYLSTLLAGKRYVIDTSRNGNGPAPDFEWCNPDGRALGESPRLFSGGSALDAYLWIKFPGESDGHCGGGPRAGAWWPEYAVGLYQNRGL